MDVLVKYRCPRCTSDRTVRHGFNITVRKGRQQRRRCQKCGHTFYENREASK